MDKLLLIDDEADVRYSFRLIFEPAAIELTTASRGEEGLLLVPQAKPDLVLMDIRMGGMNGLETLRRLRQMDTKLPIILMTAYGTTQTAIEAMKLGAYDYLLKPFDVPKLKQLVAAALKAAHDMKHVVSYQPLLESEDYELGIVGRSDAMQNVFKLIGQLAASDATALITGESGTGKELVARAIYHHSQRSTQPFIAINCAAIPENLLESELFGHEKGAFTGATGQRIGKFEQCHRGTIFLDEIGDMSLATQTKILRVLQSGAFERVGGNQPLQVDVRIIAATNKPLDQAVAAREFREDLFYRLNVVRIQIPPLRERRGDIRLLVNYFLKKFAKNQNKPPKSISPEVIAALEQYGWPGNVRGWKTSCRGPWSWPKGRHPAGRFAGGDYFYRLLLFGRGGPGQCAGLSLSGSTSRGFGLFIPAALSMGAPAKAAQSDSGRGTRTDRQRAGGNKRKPGASGQIARHPAPRCASGSRNSASSRSFLFVSLFSSAGAS